jgi:hypothetical protein
VRLIILLEYRLKANSAGIERLKEVVAGPHTNSIFADFPFTRDGYAAFLMGYTQGRAFLWSYIPGASERLRG